jgi:hypothetical protein
MITMQRCDGAWRLLIVDDERCPAELMAELYLDRLGVPFGPAWTQSELAVHEVKALFTPLPDLGGVAVGYRYDSEATQ